MRFYGLFGGSLSIYTPPLKCGGVLCYTFRCLSVRPCSPFSIDNEYLFKEFFKFCIHIVIVSRDKDGRHTHIW